MIAVIDYGRGNLGSVEKAFRRVGSPAVITQDPRAVDDAQAVVLPGDGAFHDAMSNLDRLGLLPAVRRALDGHRPFLGICLGYQLLFSTSEEFGEGRGLDVVPGAVRRLPAGHQKIPHMGWNRVEHGGDLAIFDGIPSGARFYFVHSYYPVLAGMVVAGAVRPAWTEGGPTQERVAPDARAEASDARSVAFRHLFESRGVSTACGSRRRSRWVGFTRPSFIRRRARGGAFACWRTSPPS